MKNRIILASSSTWHSEVYKKVKSYSNLEPFLVTTQQELKEKLLHGKAPRYIFFLHWNWKVSAEIIRDFECVCFHITDLPFGRGGSPLQNLIVRGYKETILTTFRMTEDIDAGPIYRKEILSLAGSAHEIFARTASLCEKTIHWMLEKEPKPKLQVGSPTYFERRQPKQSALPNNGKLTSVYDFIRMLDGPGYPSAFIKYGSFIIEFSDASIENGEIRANAFIRQGNSNE